MSRSHRTCHLRWKEAGFTLMELIITIVLIGIISGVAAMLILQGMRFFVSEDTRADLTNQSRLAIERMGREVRTIRRASEISGPITNPSSSLQFVDITGTTITYSLSGTTLNRTVGGTPAPLAEKVTTLEFRHYDKADALTTTPANVWKIQVDLTVTKGDESQTFRIRVYPRNFT